MNKANLKSYAPQARKDFIAAVTARANLLGLSERAGMLEVAASQPQGDVTVIAGQAWPVKVHKQRDQLVTRIGKDGFAHTVDAVAYTWFNRFAALRYMELHGYLDHGHRALSSTDSSLPDILTFASDLAQSGELPGLKPALVTEMKLAGNRDGELYRMLLVAQCNALSAAMPFLFERIDDETELLLPDNLLRTDSVIAKLVDAIDEEDWKEVEIIGWLYQFYIAEEKERVDRKLKAGGTVEWQEIPAKTQLFTPKWVVQYLVHNSIGRLWMMANPTSTLNAQWPYYIEPAQQAPDVQTQLNALIQVRMDEDGGSLNPESITLLDPACGSGHILVEAYEVLKAIYLERGYQPRAVPRLILEKNLFGLDIDDRAAQMAGFALMMKARADDRRLFSEPIKLNVMSLQESKGLNAEVLTRALQTVTSGARSQLDVSISASEFGASDLFPGTQPQMNLGEALAADTAHDQARPAIVALISTFAQAKTFGSLIQIPRALFAQLSSVADSLQMALKNGDLYAKAAAQDLLPLVAQARVLGTLYDVTAANPPYMGSKGMSPVLKDYARAIFPDSKSDLFAMFMERGFGWCKQTGFSSMVTMQSWMFLSSYEVMRKNLLRERTLSSMVHMGNGVMGIAFGTAATVIQAQHVNNVAGNFSYCDNDDIGETGFPKLFPVSNERLKVAKPDNFKKIPGSPIAYWLTPKVTEVFVNARKLGDIAEARMGLATGDNDKYVRLWFECRHGEIGFEMPSREVADASGCRWFPYSKGGAYRRWYGNNEYVVDWLNDGFELQTTKHETGRVWAHNFNLDNIFKESITWSDITSGAISVRFNAAGFLFDGSGTSAFFRSQEEKLSVLGFLNTSFANEIVKVLNPTFHFQTGDFRNLPFDHHFVTKSHTDLIAAAVALSKQDWDAFEVSWDFSGLPLIGTNRQNKTLEIAWKEWSHECQRRLIELKDIERENNRFFINAYGLQDELSPEVPERQITLARADREKDCQRLMSYAIGCMMGRYSLSEPGLIYAQAGNVGFDTSRYATFPADSDGIVPLTDELWFEDDAASRIPEFLHAVWGTDTLTENMAWLAESLGTKASETPDETIRRYLADKFYKDHLQTYKKRPIYWLFSSGKQGAFQALVYLHRYHEGTLARVRAEYVVPLTGKIQSRIDMLQKDGDVASSTAARNKLAKEVEKLKKKHVELLSYDEQLRHHADTRITLNLDEGVKVNYGKFGDLLDSAKLISAASED